MSVVDVLFYADAFMIVACAALAVSMRHLLHAALALMMSLFCTAGLFVLMEAEFAALVQIMVYIGGVVIFIVYTILLTAHLGEEVPRSSTGKALLAGAGTLVLAALMLFVLWKAGAGREAVDHLHDADNGSLNTIGQRLLSSGPDGFLVPFEVVSLLLLAALIGAVSLARKPTKEEEEAA